MRDSRNRRQRVSLEIAVFDYDMFQRVAVAADEAVAPVVESQPELANAAEGFKIARQRVEAKIHAGLNQFCMSLMNHLNREQFKADEPAYLDRWRMTDDQKRAVLDRDYNRMITLGGNIYFLSKIFSTDGLSFEQAAASMTGLSTKEYRQMMLAGGRSPKGNRYKVE